jgi:signal transduction histidine kinase
LSTPEQASGDPSAALLLARAGWLDLLDDIHGGLCHDLNSRVSSVEGLLQILELGAADASETLGYLGPEAERLARMGQRLSYLSGRVDATPEAFAPYELLEEAVPLLERHRPFSRLEMRLTEAPGVAPVRGCRPRLLRVLLLILARAAAAAGSDGAPELILGWGEANGSVELRIRRGSADGGAWGPASLAGIEEPLAALLAMEGGSLLVQDQAVGLRLPALRRS